MSGKPCKRCSKTAYPLEAIKVGEETYHKLCFRCPEPKCDIQLNLKNFKRDPASGLAYCEKHLPKNKHTQVADSLLTKAALNAPKRPNEKGLFKADPRTQPKVSDQWTNDREIQSGQFESTPEASSAETGGSWGHSQVQSGEFESNPEPSHAGAGGTWGQSNVDAGTFENNPDASHAGAGGTWGQSNVDSGTFENTPEDSHHDG